PRDPGNSHGSHTQPTRRLTASGRSEPRRANTFTRTDLCAAAFHCKKDSAFPLIEAAQFVVPIVAAELPVFREAAGESAYYVSGSNAEDLAGTLQQWLGLGNAAQNRAIFRGLAGNRAAANCSTACWHEQPYRFWPDKAHGADAPPVYKSTASKL